MRINFFRIIMRFKKLLPLLLLMLIIQSVFSAGGDVLLSFQGVNILTTNGINTSLCILFRLLTFSVLP